MALRANNAYEGDATMPNGVVVRVFFLDRRDIRHLFGREHPSKRHRVGWYWRHYGDAAMPFRVTAAGPFTSSRRAMVDALKHNAAEASNV